MGYKRFVKAIVIFIVLLVPANFAVWQLHTKKFFDGYDPSAMGDLARLGYMPEYGVSKPPPEESLPGLLQYNEYHGQPVDMVVIGDSFAMGVGGGEHAFFHEYIILNSGREDFTVLNLVTPSDSGVGLVWKLINTGLLEKIGPRYILIESAEWACIEVGGLSPEDPSLTDDPERLVSVLVRGGEIADRERKGKVLDETDRPFFRFMTYANLKHPLYKVLYRITDRPPGARVYKAELDRPLFSTEHPETLLYLDANIEKMSLVSEASVAMLNQNLNVLAGALAERGIKLYFMSPPDKYGLYEPYIRDNDLPVSPFFALMRKQDRRYGFIDTMAILSEALDEGVMDIYHQDDTHWSWRASDRIFSTFRFEPPLAEPRGE